MTSTAPPLVETGTVTTPRRRSPLWHAMEGFRFAPFRWYMAAIIWWNAAMSMQMLVRGYLAYQLTDSFTSLGLVGLGTAIPLLTLAPFGGVIADRAPRRMVLQIGQLFTGSVAVVIAVLIFADSLRFWHLFAASVAQGAMFALVMPSQQAFMADVVGLGRLMNAIPLQTAGMNLMQILAPALGGFMIDWIGPGSVYLTMSVMFAISVAMLFFVRTLSPEERAASKAETARGLTSAIEPDTDLRNGRTGPLAELRSGFAYLRRDRLVLVVLAFSFLSSTLGMPIRILLPGYAADIFGDKGSTLGLLQMGMGIGALVGALGLASLREAHHRGRLLAASAAVLGAAMLLFSATGMLWLAWVGLAVVGVGSSGRMALSQVLVQEYVDDDYRGRIMALYMMQFSLMQVGAFLVSLFMEAVGPRVAIQTLAIALVVATAAFMALVPRFRALD